MPRPVLETGVRRTQDGIHRQVEYRPDRAEYIFTMRGRDYTAQHRVEQAHIAQMTSNYALREFERYVWRELDREIERTRLRARPAPPPAIGFERYWVDEAGSVPERTWDDIERMSRPRPLPAQDPASWGNPFRANREEAQRRIRDLAQIFEEEDRRNSRAIPELRKRSIIPRALPG